MAKRIKNLIALLVLPVLIFAVAFAGCGEYVPPTGGNGSVTDPGNQGGSNKPGDTGNPDDPENPGTSDDPNDPGEPDPFDGNFGVRLVLVNKNAVERNFTSEICKDVVKMVAQWTDKETGDIFRSPFDERGIAINASLDGDYTVSILNIPKGYTYETNIYTANNYEKQLNVILYELGTLGSKKRLGDYSYYKLNNTGVYRTELTSEDDKVMFQFAPTRQGVYSFLTLVDITANEINPLVDVHNGNIAWINPNPMITVDGGRGVGMENSYTKNAYWSYDLTTDEVGNVFYFVLYSTCINVDAYPLTVDFIVQRDGDFHRRYTSSTAVEVTEDFSKTPTTPKGKFTYCANRGGTLKMLDQSLVKLNPEDGYYYYYDEVTGEFNEHNRLYARITSGNEVSDEGFTGEHVIGLLNYLVGYDRSDPKYYTSFIKTYASHVNGDGCYPVNEELKTFLQIFAVSQAYFLDGKGLAELFARYNADEDSQWMYACGFYA